MGNVKMTGQNYVVNLSLYSLHMEYSMKIYVLKNW